MDKRVFLGLALMFVVLGFYPVLLQKIYPEYGKSLQAEREAKSRPAAAVSAPDAPNRAAARPGTVLSATDYDEKYDVLYKNDELRLIFNSKGGGIRDISFLEFMDDERQEPLKFISAKNPAAAPLSMAVFSPALAGQDEAYDIRLEGNDVVVSALILDKRVRVTRRIQFASSGYAAGLSVTLENVSSAALDLQYELYAGSRIPPRHSIDSQYIEANFFTTRDGKKNLRHINESGAGKTVSSEGPVDWLAVKDRHFSVILKPEDPGLFTGIVKGLGDHQFAGALVSPAVTLAAGASVTHDFAAYIGPNDLDSLAPAKLEEIVNFGKMDLIGKFFIGGLEMLHGVFRNYGLAIIALTFLINLFLFPLTRQSFMSMKRMQLVQPQMTKLREQHKDNPQRLNKEMMELYKKHKVNPFGGCLPMLLQMPVFIALYVAISKFVKLIGADFLWVKDLSSPDAVALPFSLPFIGSSIHVLPIIMIAGMMLQQRISASSMPTTDPAMLQQQKMMAWMMPIIFGFIFYTMPSALVLYWLTNTILMTGYQLHLKRVTITI